MVFDMDETLVHAEIKKKGEDPIEDVDFSVELKTKDEEVSYMVYVKMRPYYDQCIEHLSKYYELVVFTAAE